jgi:hypothetical protein
LSAKGAFLEFFAFVAKTSRHIIPMFCGALSIFPANVKPVKWLPPEQASDEAGDGWRALLAGS